MEYHLQNNYCRGEPVSVFTAAQGPSKRAALLRAAAPCGHPRCCAAPPGSRPWPRALCLVTPSVGGPSCLQARAILGRSAPGAAAAAAANRRARLKGWCTAAAPTAAAAQACCSLRSRMHVEGRGCVEVGVRAASVLPSWCSALGDDGGELDASMHACPCLSSATAAGVRQQQQQRTCHNRLPPSEACVLWLRVLDMQWQLQLPAQAACLAGGCAHCGLLQQQQGGLAHGRWPARGG